MSAAKHTPGLWVADIEGANTNSVSILGPDPRLEVAVIINDGEDLTDTDLANARLIAAAPALLEALEKLRNETLGVLGLSRHEIRLTIGNTNFAVLQARLDEAEAAIRLAKGE